MLPLLPLGIATLASTIKTNHEVHIFDPNITPRWKKELSKTIASLKPDVVGISLRNTDSVDYIGRESFYPDFKVMIKIVKENMHNGTVIVGGSGFSLFASHIMAECPEIDIGFFLEADESLPELLENMESPDKVKGLYYRKNEEIIFTGQREPVDFASTKSPAYELFDLKKYIPRFYGIGIESKRGCGLSCSYCPYSFLNGKNVRLKSPEKVVDEIEKVIALGVNRISFVDSVFNLPLDHSIEICREITRRKLDVTWSCWSNEKTFTEDFARTAMEAGCRAFPFSTDAFSNKSLEMLKKNYTNADIRRTVEIAKKIDGINVGYGFFLNPPGSSIRSFLNMMVFLVKTKLTLGGKMKKVFAISRIRIEPHTPLHQRAIKEGVVAKNHNLLAPVYYTQPSTRIIEFAYGIFAFPIEIMIRLKRIIKIILKDAKDNSSAPAYCVEHEEDQ
jgi:radical SAM superfamily enzyme YgiQ (UPF0313 family)